MPLASEIHTRIGSGGSYLPLKEIFIMIVVLAMTNEAVSLIMVLKN